MINNLLTRARRLIIPIGALTLIGFSYHANLRKIEVITNELAELEHRTEMQQQTIENLFRIRQVEAETVAALQNGQTEIARELQRRFEQLGKLSHESKIILDNPLPDDIARLLSSGPGDK